MNEENIHETSATPPQETILAPAAATEDRLASRQMVVPAQACPTRNAPRTAAQTAPNSWVYVIGDVDPRYPSLAVEKEAMGAMARAGTAGLSNDAALPKPYVMP